MHKKTRLLTAAFTGAHGEKGEKGRKKKGVRRKEKGCGEGRRGGGWLRPHAPKAGLSPARYAS